MVLGCDPIKQARFISLPFWILVYKSMQSLNRSGCACTLNTHTHTHLQFCFFRKVFLFASMENLCLGFLASSQVQMWAYRVVILLKMVIISPTVWPLKYDLAEPARRTDFKRFMLSGFIHQCLIWRHIFPPWTRGFVWASDGSPRYATPDPAAEPPPPFTSSLKLDEC